MQLRIDLTFDKRVIKIMAYSCHGLAIGKILGPNLWTISNPSLHFQIMLNIRRRRVLFHLIHYWWYINNLWEIACLRWHGIKSIFISEKESHVYLLFWLLFYFFKKSRFIKKMTAIIGKHYNVFTVDQIMDSISLSATLL